MSDIEYKSEEEKQFAMFLDECKEHQLIYDYAYETMSFELLPDKTYVEAVSGKKAVKLVERSLHASANYTPDFRVTFSERGLSVLRDVFKKSILTSKGNPVLWFDTKGTFSRQDDGRHFSLLQKLFYDKHGIWVERVVPKKLFPKAFAPEGVRWMKARKKPTKTKMGLQSKTIDEFLKENEDENNGN